MNNHYENSFVHGRELAKNFVIGTCVGCVLSVISMIRGTQLLQLMLMAFTLVCMGCTIYVMYKYCKCPHCGKHINMGLLAVEECPRCRRNLVTGKKGKKKKY